MAKKLKLGSPVKMTVSRAMLVLIINVVITALTFWQTQNYEVSTSVFVGVTLAVLALILKYENEIPEVIPVTSE